MRWELPDLAARPADLFCTGHSNNFGMRPGGRGRAGRGGAWAAGFGSGTEHRRDGKDAEKGRGVMLNTVLGEIFRRPGVVGALAGGPPALQLEDGDEFVGVEEGAAEGGEAVGGDEFAGAAEFGGVGGAAEGELEGAADLGFG